MSSVKYLVKLTVTGIVYSTNCSVESLLDKTYMSPQHLLKCPEIGLGMFIVPGVLASAQMLYGVE